MALDDYARPHAKLQIRLRLRNQIASGEPVYVFTDTAQQVDYCAVAHALLAKHDMHSLFLFEIDAKKPIIIMGGALYKEIGNIYANSNGSEFTAYKKKYGPFIIRGSKLDGVDDFAKTTWRSKNTEIGGFEYFDQYCEYAQCLLGDNYPKRPC